MANAKADIGPMECLHAHVPLALLIDMLDETGPDSAAIYQQEAADTAWVPRARDSHPSESPSSSSE